MAGNQQFPVITFALKLINCFITSNYINRARAAGINGNQTMLFLQEPPLPEDLEERIRTGRKAAEILGTDHFFDLHRGGAGSLRLPGELKKALASLGKSKD